MLTKTRAIVLRSIKYGEQSLIVDLFTQYSGRLSFVVRIPKSSRGKLKKQLFQPATILDLEFDYRPRLSLQQIKSASIASPLMSVVSNPYKLSIVLFLCEFLVYATKDEQQNTPLYNFIESGLEWLERANEGFANFHVIFLSHLTLFLGFCPNLDSYGPYFDLRGGGFVSSRPLHPDYLEHGESDLVASLMRLDYNTMRLFKLNRSQRWRCLEVILKYYQLHLPDFPELKSLDVLRELFD